jgi:RNA polymerase sigma-70 factor (ECF subfamily)
MFPDLLDGVNYVRRLNRSAPSGVFWSTNDPIVRLNRAVAVAEVAGAATALREGEALASPSLEEFLPYHAVYADLLRRNERMDVARAAYAKAIARGPSSAERRWLERKAAELRG